MRRFALATAAVLAVAVPATLAAAPSGDQTVKGSLFVQGNAQIVGSLVVIGGSAVADLRSDYLSAPRIAVTSGGFGYGWLNEAGVEVTRIVAGQFNDPTGYPAPPSSLLIRRDPAQLWFRTDAGWTCLSGC